MGMRKMRRCEGLLSGKNRDSQRCSKQFEVRTVGGNDGCSVAPRSECDQRIVLEVSAFVYIPVLLVADDSDEPPGLPPVGDRRFPPDRGQIIKVGNKALRFTPATRRSSDKTTAEWRII